jgi:hypothetical protein
MRYDPAAVTIFLRLRFERFINRKRRMWGPKRSHHEYL